MKPIFKILLKYYLKCITIVVLKVHRPLVVAVAGSTNKTFTVQALVNYLRRQNISVRANPKSFNTEIGLPLAVLNLPSGYNSYKRWLPILGLAFKRLFEKCFPAVLVLELGVSQPGDMRYLLSLVRPTIAIVTDINQRYLESFADMDELTKEYQTLAQKVKKGGLLILNADNYRVLQLRKFAPRQVKVKTFGISQNADWQAKDIVKDCQGTKFKVLPLNKIVRLPRFGIHHIYTFLIQEICAEFWQNKDRDYETPQGNNFSQTIP